MYKKEWWTDEDTEEYLEVGDKAFDRYAEDYVESDLGWIQKNIDRLDKVPFKRDAGE